MLFLIILIPNVIYYQEFEEMFNTKEVNDQNYIWKIIMRDLLIN